MFVFHLSATTEHLGSHSAQQLQSVIREQYGQRSAISCSVCSVSVPLLTVAVLQWLCTVLTTCSTWLLELDSFVLCSVVMVSGLGSYHCIAPVTLCVLL
jgi:hypothetical protein